VKFKDGDKIKVVRVNDESMNFMLGREGFFSDAEKPDVPGYYICDFGYFIHDNAVYRWVMVHEDELERVQ
jgi:hypothetical protein